MMNSGEERQPMSPTAIGMQTGMDVPGLEDVRGPLEEALVVPPTAPTDILPGQNGAEGLAELPHSGNSDAWDGP